MKLSRVAAYAEARAVRALGASEPPRQEIGWPRDTVTLSDAAQEHLAAVDARPEPRPRLRLVPITKENNKL